MAAITYSAIESPIRLQPFLIARSDVTLGLAVLGAIVCVGALGAWQAMLHRSILFRKYERVVQDFPGVYRKGCDPDRVDPRPAMCFSERSPNHDRQWSCLEIRTRRSGAGAQHWRVATIIKPGLAREEMLHHCGGSSGADSFDTFVGSDADNEDTFPNPLVGTTC
jgi:hypothetical protein